MHALIATDGSEVSLDAARKAVALLHPTKVTLLSIADTSIADDSGAGGFEGNLLSPAESARAREAILAEGADEVHQTLDAIGLDPTIVEHRVVEGSAGPMICQVAGGHRPGRGRGRFPRSGLHQAGPDRFGQRARGAPLRVPGAGHPPRRRTPAPS